MCIRDRRSTPSDIYIEGDEKQLSQVFLNLLKNRMQSLEGKPHGQIEVTLEVTDKLYIKLLDNGRGIPMELSLIHIYVLPALY